ncbi:MAG: hypothetical protein ACI4RO_02450, partial [Candidatus Scatosoma sp.]
MNERNTPPPRRTADGDADGPANESVVQTDDAPGEAASSSAFSEKKKPAGKRAKRKNKIKEETEIVRFFPDITRGLTDLQVASRKEQGLNNSAPKKYSKTYGSIFFGNICTFFNFLCVVAAVALILAHAPISQFTF